MTPAPRGALADTITSVLFFSLMGALTETLVARMSFDQVLVSRVAALPVMVLSGRPYGLYRDALLARVAPIGAARWRVALADTAAFVTFQLPLYGAILWLAGTGIAQALAAMGSALVVMLVSARPYGVLLERVRRMVGAPPRT